MTLKMAHCGSQALWQDLELIGRKQCYAMILRDGDDYASRSPQLRFSLILMRILDGSFDTMRVGLHRSQNQTRQRPPGVGHNFLEAD